MEYIRFRRFIYIIYSALPSYPLSTTKPRLPLESASSTQTNLTSKIGDDEKKFEDELTSGDNCGDRSDNKCSILAEARRSFFEFFDIFFGTRSNI